MLATAKLIMTVSNGMKKLLISPSGASLCLDVIGKIQQKAKYRINVKLKSRDHKFPINVETYVLQSIIPALPNQYINISNWNFHENIDLADSHFVLQERIDVVLVAEFYYRLT